MGGYSKLTKVNVGKSFEKDFKDSVPAEFFYLRLKDSTGFAQKNENLRFTPSNPCDALLHALGTLFMFEMKSSIGTSFSFAREPKKTAMIKFNQIKELVKASAYEGVIPCFIFNFRKTDKTYLLYATDLKRFIDSTNKQSINEADMIALGAILIKHKKLISHNRYDIGDLCRNIVESKVK